MTDFEYTMTDFDFYKVRMLENPIVYQINIEQNIFTNNYLSLSNSIAIHGYSVINIAFNSFKDNGVLVESFGKSLISNYTIGNQKPFSDAEFDKFNYLGSSPVYIVAPSWLSLHDNLFQNNSSIFSGDLTIGSQITLRDIILLKDYIQIYSNIFTNNTGLSNEIRDHLNNKTLKDGNGITLPLIVLNQYLMTDLDSKFVNWGKDPNVDLLTYSTIPYITFKNCSFQYNTFSFDMSIQAYYEKSFYTSFRNMPITRIGFIKVLRLKDIDSSQASLISYNNELLSIQIIDSEFKFNSLNTEGCGLYATLIFNLTFDNTIFIKNFIYQNEYKPNNGANITLDSVTSSRLSNIDYGFICLNIDSNDDYGQNLAFLTLNITQCNFSSNYGEIITKFGTGLTTLSINNTNFTNNTCSNSALILANLNTTLYLSYSNFTNNNATFGCITIYYGWYNSLFNIFNANKGYHASVLFFENSKGNESYANISGNIAGIGIEYMYYRSSTAVQSAIIYIVKSVYNTSFCNITENIASAGLFYGISSELYFDSGIFANNTYPSYTNKISAILVFITSASYFTCKNYIITNNSGIGGTPKVYNMGLFVNYISYLIFVNNTIYGNTLSSDSYIIQSISANIIIDNTIFFDNNSSSSTSTLIFGNYGDISILNSNFINNSNILSISSAIITIYNSKFINNNNQIIGEKNELAAFAPIKVDIEYCIFKDFIKNSIPTNGNFLSIVQAIDIFIQNVNFSDIHYDSGAAIKITGRSSLIINESNFFNISFNNDATITCSNIIEMKLYHTIFDAFEGPSTHISIDSSSELRFLAMNSIFYNSTNKPSMIITESMNIIMINLTIIANAEAEQFPYNNMNFTQSLVISGISINKFKNVFICNSTLKHNKYVRGALQLIYQIANANVSIINTTFQDNLALSGGAIAILTEANYMNMKIQNCNFYRNSVLNQSSLLGYQAFYGKGGAVYYSCDRSMDYICNLVIFDSIFSYNTAVIAGGAIYWDYFPPYNNTGLIFVNNSAQYGSDLASYPVYIYPANINLTQIVNVTYDSSLFLRNLMIISDEIKNLSSRVISGNCPIDDIQFGLFDIYGQTDINDGASNILINPIQNLNDNYSIRVNPSLIRTQQGKFNISEFSLDYYPLRNSSIIFQALSILKLPLEYIKVIRSFNETIGEYMANLNAQHFNMLLNFIDCPIGYIFSISTSNNNKYGICILCSNGTYSLDPQTFQKQNDRKCISCEYDIFKSCSGSNIYLQPGYWRMNATADIILKCPNEEYCPGNMNNTYFTKYDCNDNTEGNLCNKCDFNSAKFGSQTNCMNCKLNALYYILLFIVIIVQVVFINYNISCTINEFSEYQNNNNQRNHNEELKSNLLKILTNYTQIISLINIFNIQFPSALTNSFSILSYWSLSNDQYFSFDCFIILLSTNLAIKVLNIKLLCIFSSPVLTSVLTCLIWIIIFKIKKRKIIQNKDFRNKLITSIVILIYNLQPNLLKYGFILFHCLNLYREDQPLYYLNADYDFQCWDNNHLEWALGLGLTNIILWGIIIPFIILYHLYTHRYNLNDNSIKLKYAFLYKGYIQERYYWEFVVIFRKFILITITVFFNLLSTTLQIMASISTIAIFLALQIRVKPFKDSILNVLETKSLLSSLLVTFNTLYFLNNSQRYIPTDIIILCIMGFSYIYFYLSWIWDFWKAIKHDIYKNRRKIHKLFIQLKKCKWCFRRVNIKIYDENSENSNICKNSKNLQEISQVIPKMNPLESSYLIEEMNSSNRQDIKEYKMNELSMLECYSLHNSEQQQQQFKMIKEYSRAINVPNAIENHLWNPKNLRINIPQTFRKSNLNNPKQLYSNKTQYDFKLNKEYESPSKRKGSEIEENKKDSSPDKLIYEKETPSDIPLLTSLNIKEDILEIIDEVMERKVNEYKNKDKELSNLIISETPTLKQKSYDK